MQNIQRYMEILKVFFLERQADALNKEEEKCGFVLKRWVQKLS